MIYFPNNIFTQAIILNLPEQRKKEIKLSSSSLLVKKIVDNNENVGLVPTTDLINHKELFVSNKFGISFEGALCNNYIYFKQKENIVNELNLFGDVSSIEVIIGKILFKEMYNSDVKIKLIADNFREANKNLIVIGDKNFESESYKSGISLAEEIADLLTLPFVNYILVSNSEEKLKQVEGELVSSAKNIYNTFGKIEPLKKYTEETRNYILSNLSSLTFQLEEQDLEGIQNLLQLPYYHGVMDDMIEIKFLK